MAVPVFQSILNCEPDNGSFLQMNSNCGCDNPIEELLESYLAFTERRYMNAGEMLTALIDKCETKFIIESPILVKLYQLKAKCDLHYEKFEMECTNELEPHTVNSKKETSLLGCTAAQCLCDNSKENSTVKQEWSIIASRSAQNTVNPIRRIVDRCKLSPNPEKPLISLSIGDPTTYGNMLPPVEASAAVNEAFAKPTSHGYVPSCGAEEARSAVAKLWSRDDFVLDSKDIILTSGCSHALEMCFNCVADPNDNILLPQPGFSLYLTLCHSLNIEPKFYNLIPDRNWEVDLKSMEAAINEKTKAVVVNNPSNPCGAVYSAEHLQKIIDLCEKYRLPIIADEIYADMVFPGNKFYFMGPLSKNVPILSCGGLAKRYICPGWRVGWIALYDRNDLFKKSIRPGLLDLSSRILGPSSVIQAALPDILANTPVKYFEGIINQIETNAKVCYETLSRAPGLKPIMPLGTMYMLVGIDTAIYDDVESDTVFFTKLFNEQSISCLPASVFGAANFFRVVLTVPADKTREACERIVQFCIDHQIVKNAERPRLTRSISRVVNDEGLAKPEESILPFHTKSSKYK